MTSNSALVQSPLKDEQHFIPTLSPEKLQSIRQFGKFLSEDKENIDPVNFAFSTYQSTFKGTATEPVLEVLRENSQVKNKKRQ